MPSPLPYKVNVLNAVHPNVEFWLFKSNPSKSIPPSSISTICIPVKRNSKCLNSSTIIFLSSILNFMQCVCILIFMSSLLHNNFYASDCAVLCIFLYRRDSLKIINDTCQAIRPLHKWPKPQVLVYNLFPHFHLFHIYCIYLSKGMAIKDLKTARNSCTHTI